MNDHLIHQNRIRQVFFLVIIVLLGLLLFSELYTFLPALLGAVTLYIVMRRWMFHLTIMKKWRKGWTAALLMLLSMIVILLPIALLINMLSSKITFAIQHSNTRRLQISTNFPAVRDGRHKLVSKSGESVDAARSSRPHAACG